MSMQYYGLSKNLLLGYGTGTYGHLISSINWIRQVRLSISLINSVTRKKSPNVYKSCPKMISLEKLNILTPLQKLPKNVGDLGKLIVAKDFKKLLKVQ